jgi:hypothetical protein
MAVGSTTWRIEHGRGVLQTARGELQLRIDQMVRGLSDDEAVSLAGGREKDIAVGSEDMYLLGVQVPGFPERLPAAWLVDYYVRRNDLIATYERPHPDHLRVQVYWRYLHDAPRAGSGADAFVEGMHLMVSLQTDRLDRQPTVSVINQLAGDQVKCLHLADDVNPTARFQAPVTGGSIGERDAGRAVDTSGTLVHPGPSADAPLWIIRREDLGRSTVLMTLPADLVRVAFRRCGALWRHEFHLLDEHLEKGVIRRAQVVAWWVPSAGDEDWARTRFDRWCAEPPPLTT